MRKLPITTRIDGIDVKPVFGQRLFDMYSQISRLLSIDPVGRQLIDFFAEPAVHKTDRTINWYTKAQGVIRAWVELSPKEQQEAIEVVNRNCQLVREICDRLVQSQGESSATVEALRAMLITPSLQESLCVVGTKVVLAQWGCRPFGTAAGDYALEIQGERAKSHDLKTPSFDRSEQTPVDEVESFGQSAGEIDAPANAGFADSESLPPDSGAAETPAPVDETSDRTSRSLIWRWVLIWTLIALLLIGLLLKSCSPQRQVTVLDEQERLGEIAALMAIADERLLQCRPISSGSSSQLNEPTAVLTPQALERNQVDVFSGRWVLRSDAGLVIDDKPIAMEIQFDASGSGVTRLVADDGTRCSGRAQVKIDSPSSFQMSLSSLDCTGSFPGVSANLAKCTVREGGRVANCVLSCINGPCDAEFLRN